MAVGQQLQLFYEHNGAFYRDETAGGRMRILQPLIGPIALGGVHPEVATTPTDVWSAMTTPIARDLGYSTPQGEQA